jgi:hypothetical protein
MVLNYKWTLSQHKEVNRALEIVLYLKQQGLVNNTDFTFSVNPETENTEFFFHKENAEKYASMISLKFL